MAPAPVFKGLPSLLNTADSAPSLLCAHVHTCIRAHHPLSLVQSYREDRDLKMLRPKILYDLPVSLFDLLQLLSVLVCNRSMSREETGMETQIDINRCQRGSVPHRLEADPLATQASHAIDFACHL